MVRYTFNLLVCRSLKNNLKNRTEQIKRYCDSPLSILFVKDFKEIIFKILNVDTLCLKCNNIHLECIMADLIHLNTLLSILFRLFFYKRLLHLQNTFIQISHIWQYDMARFKLYCNNITNSQYTPVLNSCKLYGG